MSTHQPGPAAASQLSQPHEGCQRVTVCLHHSFHIDKKISTRRTSFYFSLIYLFFISIDPNLFNRYQCFSKELRPGLIAPGASVHPGPLRGKSLVRQVGVTHAHTIAPSESFCTCILTSGRSPQHLGPPLRIL